MNDLIRIEKKVIGNGEINAVDARELWKFMEVKRDFSNWIRDYIRNFNFQENQDFITFTENCCKVQMGRPSKEYMISIDMAMILSSHVKHPKGADAYKYFCDLKGKEVVMKFQKRQEYQFEKVVKNLFSGYEVIQQFYVLGKYKLDWYIPELKLAIEFDEQHHQYNLEKDDIRQKEIEKCLGCRFLRYTVY